MRLPRARASESVGASVRDGPGDCEPRCNVVYWKIRTSVRYPTLGLRSTTSITTLTFVSLCTSISIIVDRREE